MLFTVEMLPRQFKDLHAACQQVAHRLPKAQLQVFVPHINGSSYNHVLEAVANLVNHGYQVVPHLAVRNLQKDEHFDRFADAYAKLGVRSMLLLGGDNPEPRFFHSVGEFLADETALAGMKLEQIFFPTFPDGHPHLPQVDALDHLKAKCALADKRGLTTRLINQVTFEASSIIEHRAQLAEYGINAPLHLGCVGPTNFVKMFKTATMIGLNRAFKLANSHDLMRLIMHYNLDAFVTPLLEEKHLGGIHFFPFGNYSSSLKRLADFAELVSTQESECALPP